MHKLPTTLTVRRSFVVWNSGEVAFVVINITINGVSCENRGFQILNCGRFTLKPNENHTLEIALVHFISGMVKVICRWFWTILDKVIDRDRHFLFSDIHPTSRWIGMRRHFSCICIWMAHRGSINWRRRFLANGCQSVMLHCLDHNSSLYSTMAAYRRSRMALFCFHIQYSLF
jgi:hypothetical protein